MVYDTFLIRTLLDPQPGILRPVVVPPRELASVVRLECAMELLIGRLENMSPTGTWIWKSNFNVKSTGGIVSHTVSMLTSTPMFPSALIGYGVPGLLTEFVSPPIALYCSTSRS